MSAEKKKVNRVLAEGEVTNHAHRADVGEVIEQEGRRLFVTDRPAKVNHEEHKTVTVPPGQHEVRRVKEFDHFAEEAREVAD